MSINVLHISNGFLGLSKVHTKLYTKLDEFKITQMIFAPVRKGKIPREERALQFEMPDSKIVFSRFLKKTHKFLFRSKISFLYKDLKNQIDLEKVNAIHATTLYSDGAIALKVYKEFGKGYIVTVRNTDVNIFLKYRPDLIFLAKKILDNADKIIFTNKAFQNRLFSHAVIKNNKDKYLEKSVIINNGIDNFWLDNLRKHDENLKTANKIIYVGRLSKNKNLPLLIGAVVELNKKYRNLTLEIIGDGVARGEVELLAKLHPEAVIYRGSIYDIDKLISHYRSNHIFAMPSLVETFGLVYIEALSQGLPVLYSQNQGIDGVFDENIGERVNPHDVKSVEEGLDKIIRNYNKYNVNEVDFQRFKWDYIASLYENMYKNIAKSA